MTDLNSLLAALTRLKRGNSPGLGKAPHKPVLLMTLLELMERGRVSDNRFYPNAELVGVFQENWRLLVTTPHQEDFTQPFYHLQNDQFASLPIWMVKPLPGCQYNAPIKSVHTLANVVAYGYLDDRFFQIAANPEQRRVIIQSLLQTYFPNQAEHFEKQRGRHWFLSRPAILDIE